MTTEEDIQAGARQMMTVIDANVGLPDLITHLARLLSDDGGGT